MNLIPITNHRRVPLALTAMASLFMLGATHTQAAIYDDFNDGTIDGEWATIGPGWGIEGGNRATSKAVAPGESATGSLISNAIALGAGEWLSLEVQGHSALNTINIRQNTSGGTIIATIEAPGSDTLRTYQIDPRGASNLVVEAIDANSGGGFAWIGIDTVQTVTGLTGTRIATNGDFEDNTLTGWTEVSGTVWEVLGQQGSFNDGAAEGGRWASTRNNEGATGTLRSPGITATNGELIFHYAGYGSNDGSDNRIELLDDTFAVISTFSGLAASGDGANGEIFRQSSFDLDALGLTPGSTVYLQAVDERSGGFAWMALDEIRTTGLIPEPASLALLSLGSLMIAGRQRRRV